MSMEIFFLISRKFLVFTGNFQIKSSKSIFLTKSLSASLILAQLQSAGFKYMTKHHLKHSLSSVF